MYCLSCESEMSHFYECFRLPVYFFKLNLLFLLVTKKGSLNIFRFPRNKDFKNLAFNSSLQAHMTVKVLKGVNNDDLLEVESMIKFI